MTTIEVTIKIDTSALRRHSDERLALLWHVAQANPAPIEDRNAGEVAEEIGREIIRRWLQAVPPALYHHQGRHHHLMWLSRVAKYVPGSSDFNDGEWVAKAEADGGQPDHASPTAAGVAA